MRPGATDAGVAGCFCAALGLATLIVGATLANITILHALPLMGLSVILLAFALALAWLRRFREV